MSEKLYWEHPYLRKFEAEVVKILPEGLVFDKTLFYPQGGGQNCDKGYISLNDKNFEVVSVIKEKGNIVHQLKPELVEYFKKGDIISGTIDWEYRYGLMKAHTSQHVISSIARNMFKNETERAFISFEDVTMQFENQLTFSNLKSLIEQANHIFTGNSRTIQTEIINKDDFREGTFNIRGEMPDKENIRIVQVEGLDQVCCGGTHVKTTNEIGPILLYRFQKSIEIRYLVGSKALSNLTEINIELVSSLEKTKKTIFDIKDVLDENFQKINIVSGMLNKLQQEYIDYISKNPSITIDGNFINIISFEIDDKLIRKAFKKYPVNSILIKVEKENKLVIYSNSKAVNAKEIVNDLLDTYSGKGGGSNFSAQCSITEDVTNIEDILIKVIKRQLKS